MISKNKSQFIKSLQLKKNREEAGQFVVEGGKSVLELAKSDFRIRTIVCAEGFWKENKRAFEGGNYEKILCSERELESVSAFKTSDSALAVADMKPITPPENLSGLVLALESLRDPGNLGTILRIADWFGIPAILASEDTTDFYNPKTLQASMGSFCRVKVHPVNLERQLGESRLPVFATRMNGEPVHGFAFPKDCILLLGSESHGISPALAKLCKKTLGIPAYGKAESLNVAAAAAVLCDNYRRLSA